MPKYSQVFLADESICAEIAGALDGETFDRVIEIGPGGGALTAHLYPKYKGAMKAVEIDPRLVPALNARFPGLEVVNSDFLEADLATLAGPGRTAFIGNLPYECSTAILEKTLFFPGFEFAVFMFQKEVANRILAAPGDHDYGYLSLLAASRSAASLVLDVKAANFKPVPAVDSAVVAFKPRKFFQEKVKEEAFRALVRKAFTHRRKTLINSLSLCGVEKAVGAAAVEKAGFKPTVRAQEISLEGFSALADILGGKK